MGGQTTTNLTGASPKRDCSAVRVKRLAEKCYPYPGTPLYFFIDRCPSQGLAIFFPSYATVGGDTLLAAMLGRKLRVCLAPSPSGMSSFRSPFFVACSSYSWFFWLWLTSPPSRFEFLATTTPLPPSPFPSAPPRSFLFRAPWRVQFKYEILDWIVRTRVSPFSCPLS